MRPIRQVVGFTGGGTIDCTSQWHHELRPEDYQVQERREALMLNAFRRVPPVTQDFFYACLRTRAAKNADYTMGKAAVDEIANFRDGGGFVKLTMPQVWWVYFWKHLTAIIRWIVDGKVASEPLWKRCMDVAVYASLLVVISMESNEAAPTKIEQYEAQKDS